MKQIRTLQKEAEQIMLESCRKINDQVARITMDGFMEFERKIVEMCKRMNGGEDENNK